MIISHKYKFIFIKTRKTAGSSIERILLDHLGRDDVFAGMICEGHSPINVLAPKKITEHVGQIRIKSAYPHEWNNYFKFAVERNPWDKAVSFYHWYQHSKPYKVKQGFSNFVLGKNFGNRNDWKLYANSNSILVDSVINYENLNNEFSNICQRLGIPYRNELKQTKLKGKFREDNKSYKEYYSLESKARVAEIFTNVIETFDYKF